MRCPNCLAEMDEFHDHRDGEEEVRYKCPYCGHEETHVYHYNKRRPKFRTPFEGIYPFVTGTPEGISNYWRAKREEWKRQKLSLPEG